MTTISLHRGRTALGLTLLACLMVPPPLRASGLPVTAAHPRIYLTPAEMTRLLAKKSANDPSWIALKSQADLLKTYTINPYTYATRTQEPDNTIFYDYQGSDWFESTMPLGLAYQLTGDTAYSTKLIQLADELLRAQSDPNNNPPIGYPPLQPDSYFPTRFVGPTAAVIYDWCYGQLGSVRRAQLVTLMNAYFDDLRANAYQNNTNADGNYFGGHLICALFMGYATYGDNPRAEEMIDYGRMRFDGTASALVTPANTPSTYFTQCFEGSFPSGYNDRYGGAPVGAPFRGGLDFQGWAYGSGEYNRILDALLAVRSATGEDLFASRTTWFAQILRAEKHALFPNHSWIDPVGDWGGDYGPSVTPGLPARLAYVLAGTSEGPYAQHFFASEAVPYNFPGSGTVYRLAPWEDFFFSDATRPSTELSQPPFYSGFAPTYPQAGATNGAMPYFTMRSDWGTNATWATATMGAAFYDDHQHANAGDLIISHANEYLLVNASNWKGAAGSSGIEGASNESDTSYGANTLHFDDFGDYMYTGYHYSGGQGYWGKDEVIAADQTGGYTYVSSDLSSAYNRSSDTVSDLANRKLESFHRSLLYLRGADLFVVYDQVKAKTSTNAFGAYRKHLRWHLPNSPVVAGHLAHVDLGGSRLFIDSLLPAGASLSIVDESSNPDPCNGTVTPCTPFGDNSGTFRLEVRDPANPLAVEFLTVLQPGPTALAAPVSTLLTSGDGKMKGALIAQSGGPTSVVLFNAQAGQVPPPVTATSYAFSGSTAAVHTLGGLVPGGKYTVTSAGGVVTVTQSPAGSSTASASGVLQFTLAGLGASSYYAVVPCRAIDTRGGAGPLGAPSLSGRGVRLFTLTGTCGIPADARSVSANVTITQSATAGTLRLYRGNGSVPVSGGVEFRAAQTRANNALLALATDGSGTVAVQNDGDGAAQLIVDVTGYFR